MRLHRCYFEWQHRLLTVCASQLLMSIAVLPIYRLDSFSLSVSVSLSIYIKRFFFLLLLLLSIYFFFCLSDFRLGEFLLCSLDSEMLKNWNDFIDNENELKRERNRKNWKRIFFSHRKYWISMCNDRILKWKWFDWVKISFRFLPSCSLNLWIVFNTLSQVESKSHAASVWLFVH